MNRQVCFNELSFDSQTGEEDPLQIFNEFTRTIKALSTKGFKGVRYEHGIGSLRKEGGLDIYSLTATPAGKILYEALLSTSRHPYIDATLPEERRKEMEEGIHETRVGEEWVFGIGFSVAHHLDTVAISLPTHSKWEDGPYGLRRVGEEEESASVINVVSPGGAESEEIKQFLADRTPLELIETAALPATKPFHVRKDHGIAELKEKWEQMRRSPYVVECINSLSFARNKTYDFIDKIYDDGKIEIRLTGCDPCYGMVIQTTGRTLRETAAIAALLSRYN